MSEPKWEIKGRYFETCNCDVACPCIFLSLPTRGGTEGGCDVIVAWHVEEGKYGDTRLDNLNVVIAISTPGNMIGGNWKAALYIDERASAEQRESLAKIFSGAAGGHFKLLAGLISKVVGVKYVPINYQKTDETYSVSIPGIAESMAEPMKGLIPEKPVQVGNTPIAVVPGVLLTVGKSSINKYSDYGKSWDNPGMSSFSSDFEYSGP